MDYSLTNESIYTTALLEKKMRSVFITIPHTAIDLETIHQSLTKSKQVIYCKTAQEHHEDGDTHIHILIKFKTSVPIARVHNIIKKTLTEPPKGTIDYKAIHKSEIAADRYLDKEGNYLEYGEKPKDKKAGRPRFSGNDNRNAGAYEAIQLAQDGLVEEAIQMLKDHQPLEYIKSMESINNNLRALNQTREKFPLPEYTGVELKAWQQQLLDLVNQRPKERRIIWISGRPGCGKSFMFNYLSELSNYKYGIYNAGQCVSLDNLAYAYDEEGIIAWDFPMNFSFEGDIRGHIANVIEKFSDYGQLIASKKYKGSTKYIRGHCVVFSNRGPLNELKHRDIIHINIDSELNKTINSEFIYNNNSEFLEDVDDGYTLPGAISKCEFQEQVVSNNSEFSILSSPQEYPYEYTESNGWFHQQIKEVEAAEEAFRYEMEQKQKRRNAAMRSIKKEIKAQCQRQKQDDIEEEKKIIFD